MTKLEEELLHAACTALPYVEGALDDPDIDMKDAVRRDIDLLRRAIEAAEAAEKAGFDAPVIVAIAPTGGYCEFCPIDGGDCVVCGGGPKEAR